MTLYYYTPISQPASRTVSWSVPVRQGNAAFAQNISGDHTLVLPALSLEVISGGTAVGLGLPLASAEIVDLTAGGGVGVQVENLSASMASTADPPLSVGFSVPIASPEIVTLLMAVPYHSIPSTTSGAVIKLVRRTARKFRVWTGDPWDPSWSHVFGPGGQVTAAVSIKTSTAGPGLIQEIQAEQSNLLWLGQSHIHSIIHESTAAFAALSGVTAATIETSRAAFARLRGTFLTATDGATLRLNLTQPVTRAATQAAVAIVALQQAMRRSPAAVMIAVPAVGRGLATLHGLVTTNLAAQARPLGSVFSSTVAALQHIGTTVGHGLSSARDRESASQRTSALTKQSARDTEHALVRTTGNISTYAADPMVAAVATIVLHVVLRLLNVLTAQVVPAVTIGTLRLMLQAAAATQAQVIAVARGIQHAIGIAAAAAAACQIGAGRPFALTAAQIAALQNTASRILTLASAGVVRIIIGRFQTNALASPSVPVADARGGRLTAVFSDSVALLGMASSRLLGAVSTERARKSLSGPHTLFAQMGNRAASSSPYGKRLSAISTQRVFLKAWRFLFIPPWSWQQVITLPMAGGPAEPPSFGPFDPDDQVMVGFDWSQRAQQGDAIVKASVVSVPAGMQFSGPVFVSGTLVQVMVAPFTPSRLPATYSLRCTCTFVSGRVSSFTVPLPIRHL